MSKFIPLYILPIVVSMWLPFTFVITHALSVSFDHVCPCFPSISDTGTRPPESCVFSFLMNIATMLLCFALYIRHCQLCEFTRNRPSKGPRRQVVTLATTVGAVSCSGLLVIANCQQTVSPILHVVAVQVCHLAANIYFIFQTVFSSWMAPDMNSLMVTKIRAVTCATGILLNIAAFTTRLTADMLFLGKTIDDVLKWPKTDPGWGWYNASNIVQCMLVIDYSAYFLTFYIDFKRIQLEIPTIVVKGANSICSEKYAGIKT